MTMTVVGQGVVANGTTSVSPAYPVGYTAVAGDLCIVIVGSGHPTLTTEPAVAGYNKLLTGNHAGSNVTYGIDTGGRRLTFFGITLAAAQAAPTVTMAAGTNVVASASTVIVRSDVAGVIWQIAGGTVADNTAAASLGTAALASNPGLTVADLCIQAFASAPDTSTMSAPTLTATGITVSGIGATIVQAANTNGAQMRLSSGWRVVSTGTASTVPTLGATLSATGDGVLGLLRIREGAALALANTFEGGTAATAITTANSGGASGTAYDFVATVASATITYQAGAAYRGSLGGRFALGATAGNLYVERQASLNGLASLGPLYGRYRVKAPVLPPDATGVRLTIVADSVGNFQIDPRLNNVGKLELRTGVGTLVGTSTRTYAAGDWIDVGVAILQWGTTTGQIEMKIYHPYTGAVEQTITSAATIDTLRSGGLNRIQVGIMRSDITNFTLDFDDMNWSTTGYPSVALGLTNIAKDLDIRWRSYVQVAKDLDIRWRSYVKVSPTDLDIRWRSYVKVAATDLDIRWRTLATVQVAKDLDLRWRSAAQVAKTVDLRWRNYAQITKDLDIRWRSYTPVAAKDLDIRWRSLAQITKDLDIRWRSYARITKDLDIRWRSYVSIAPKDLDLRWRNYTRVANKDLDIRWRSYAQVLKDLDIRWRSLAQITKDLDIRWRSYTRVPAKDLDLRWRSLAQITKDLDLRWRSYVQLTKDTSLLWRSYVSVAPKDLDLRWRSLAQVAKDLDLRWRSLSAAIQVTKDLDLRWRSFAQVPQTLDLRWKSYAQVPAKDLDIRWHSLAQVPAKDLDLRWRSFARVANKDLDIRWRSYARVGLKDLDLRWRTYAQITKSLDLRWRSFARVAVDADLRWRSFAQVSKTLDLRWRSYAQVKLDLDLRWRTLAQVAVSYELIWKTEALGPVRTSPVYTMERRLGVFEHNSIPLPDQNGDVSPVLVVNRTPNKIWIVNR